MKKIIIITSIIILIIGVYLCIKAFPGEKKDYTVIPVVKGEISQNVSVAGTVIPSKGIDLQFERSGRINSVDIGVGDHVAAGQLLIALDAAELNV